MFLDEFDHLMKEKYRLKYYGRYMDDFYVILSDKQRLKEILKDIRALMDSWGLELNQKTGIFPLRNGIDFLGFHSYITESGGIVQKLRRDSIQRIRRRQSSGKKPTSAARSRRRPSSRVSERGTPTRHTAIRTSCGRIREEGGGHHRRAGGDPPQTQRKPCGTR